MTHNRAIIAERKKIIAVFSRADLETLSSYSRSHLCDINTLRSSIIIQWPEKAIRETMERYIANASREAS